MNLMTVTPELDQRVARLIDANLDRAREGLRVIEDWCRFALNRKDFVITIKDWRHNLAIHHQSIYKQARSAIRDQGAQINHPEQENRINPENIISANCSRAQEALRVLEEFTRKCDPALAEKSSKIRYGLYELELSILKATLEKERREKLESSNLCLVTAKHNDLINIVEQALAAGVRMVQYRSKQGTDKEKLKEAKQLASICKSHKALFIINDRVDLALAVDADGVHLGQSDLPTANARKILGSNRLIGRSTHCIEQLQEAEEEGCDYVGIGPIHETGIKPHTAPIGIQNLLTMSQATSLPCFAIGGINYSNLSELTSHGIKRIAVISAIINSKDPSVTSSKLLKNLS